MTRWTIAIKGYDFTIKYIIAVDNKTADALSRYAVERAEHHVAEPNISDAVQNNTGITPALT